MRRAISIGRTRGVVRVEGGMDEKKSLEVPLESHEDIYTISSLSITYPPLPLFCAKTQ